jgi:hypothetical protein
VPTRNWFALRKFRPLTWRCANLAPEDAVGREDLRPAVDAEFLDHEAEERLRLLRVSGGDDLLGLVGDRCSEVGEQRGPPAAFLDSPFQSERMTRSVGADTV